MSNLQLRVLSGALLIAVALGATWLGGSAFRLFCAVIALAMFFEWCAITRAVSDRRHQLLSGALLAAVLAAAFAGWAQPLILAAVGLGASVLFGFTVGRWGWTAAGLAYAMLSGLALGELRDDAHEGLLAILLLFAIVWTTDIMAYFVGRTVGGPKLAPAISPGKTWSGAIGGAAFATVAGVVAAFAAGVSHPWLFGFIALLLSAVSQGGDLFESWVKRRHGVKDSGRLIPGHGGVMDRVDALVAAALALYLMGLAVGRGSNAADWLFAA